jgi:predicted homoserine dehydrogenase-like protein
MALGGSPFPVLNTQLPIPLINLLKTLEKSGRTVRVGVVGCGAMGLGVAWQVARTPGMELVFLTDISEAALAKGVATSALGEVRCSGGDPLPPRSERSEIFTSLNTDALLANPDLQFDVLVECTNTIAAAARYCLAAIAKKAHVVLMNAEVDLALGQLLKHEAGKQGVVVTSDAGDQHGVLKTMIEEIELWGFRIVQAGNIKGYLERHAVSESKREIAAKLKLSVVQCIAYTDGTKLNIEMALIGNGAGLVPLQPGMRGHEFGSAKKDVKEVLDLFDFDACGEVGHIDYVVNAEPGGGVYVVGWQDDAERHFLMNYYKVNAVASKKANGGWYYLFYRPYHLCTLETPRAIAQAFFLQKPVLAPAARKLSDVYAYAKTDLPAGTKIYHGIGGDEVYGLVETCAAAEARGGGVPVCALESEGHGGDAKAAVLKKAYRQDEPIRLEDVELPDT